MVNELTHRPFGARCRGGPLVRPDVGNENVLVGGFSLPSLTAYRELFALCAGAALLAALCVLFIPRTAAATAATAR